MTKKPRDKRMTIDEVVAELEDGMTIGIGGWGPRRKPMALVRAILRSDLKDLTLVSWGGADVGLLVRAGKVRKLVYAFYDPNFSFREVIKRYPDAGGQITDCLSGDVNKDYSQLWSWIREFVPLPDDLPYGEPLEVSAPALV